MLFGNFIELLDDLVPGMWAEMLNDRGFEGVIPAANWVYYDGSPTLCDREWDRTSDWSLETAAPSTALDAPIAARNERWAGLTQSGLAVTSGESYRFSAFVRAEGDVRADVVLNTRRPTGATSSSPAEPLAASPRWARVRVF